MGLLDEAKPTPRKNRTAGLLADVVEAIDSFARKPFGYDNPPVQKASDFLGVPGFYRTLDRVSYGEPLTTGAGWATKIRPDTVDALGFVPMAPKTAALGLLGGVDTGAAKAIFAGVNAKTADKAALAAAEKMTAAGADPRAVWKETGWMKGGDGKWRFEIDDSASQINIGRVPQFRGTNAQSGTVSDALRHGGLFGAYDGIGGIDLSISGGNPTRSSASYMSGGASVPENIALNRKSAKEVAQEAADNLSFLKEDAQDAGSRDWMLKNFGGNQAAADAFYASQMRNAERKADLTVRGYTPDGGAKSDLLHELQHAVQQREGFAKGGSPEAVREDALKMVRRDVASGAIDDTVRAMQMLPMYQQHVYNRLAGEAEARAVQKRMNLTPEQRRATFPLDSYDVPIDQLIYR